MEEIFMTKQEFTKLINNLLKKDGFIKKGSNFYFDCGNDTVCVFGVDKSKLGDYCYMEYGFAFHSINPKSPFPTFSELNINCGRLFIDDDTAIHYESVNEDNLIKTIHEVLMRLVNTGKEGKEAICRVFVPKCRYIISQKTLDYLGIEQDGLRVYPETLWQ